MSKILKTSEAVLFGHPDKIADTISDAILDQVLAQDPKGHVAVETLVTGNDVILAGEISANCPNLDFYETVRRTIAEAGYVRQDLGFNAFTCKIHNFLQKQSSELSKLQAGEAVAGDQGIMTGYATDESPDYLPLQHSVAHSTLSILFGLSSTVSEIFTDAKSIATIEVDTENVEPPRLFDLVVSFHNRIPNFDKKLQIYLNSTILDQLRGFYEGFLVIPDDFQIRFNPGGPFTIGGPAGDTGLTGRKIVVDQYGDEVPVGGGAFSGKDPSKVDRSAAYYARYIAKNLVNSGICKKALVRVSYVIGNANPLSISLNTFGTNKTTWSDEEIIPKLIEAGVLSFKVSDIIRNLQLQRPIYKPTAQIGSYGNPSEWKHLVIEGKSVPVHFFPWEETNLSGFIQKTLR